MNNLVSLKIQSPRRKERIKKKSFERRLRKFAMGWQISEENGVPSNSELNLRSKGSKRVHFNIPNASKKKSLKVRMFRPLDDVARKLLEMTTVTTISSSVNGQQRFGMYNNGNAVEGSNVNEDKLQVQDVDEASCEEVEINSSQVTQIDKYVKDNTFKGSVVNSCSSHPKSTERNDNLEDEVSCGESYEDEGESNVQIVGRNEDLLDETFDQNGEKVYSSTEEKDEDSVEETMYVVGVDGNQYPLTPVTMNEWEEPYKVESEILENKTTSNYSTFDRYNFKSGIFSHGHPKRKSFDTRPIVLEMEKPGPKHYLIAERTQSRGKSVTVPLPYRDISGREQLLEECVRNSFLRRAVSDSLSTKKSTSTDMIQPYIFHVLPNNQVLLGLKYSHILFFIGKLSISVVFGTVEVLGYEMKNDGLRKTLTAYSPRGLSLLGLCASQYHCIPSDFNRLSTLDLDLCKIDEIRSEMCNIDCLLLLENVPCSLVKFISDHFPQKLFPPQGILGKKQRYFHIAEEILQCRFVSPGAAETLRLYTKRPDWETCFESITRSGKIRTMVCGGKSVGKSTFLRFLVNKCLTKYKEVLYLDFDPGQSEFTVPGCVSATLVKEPLLGPNYFHLQRPCRMVYVGEINMSRCPARYLQCVQHIIEFCHSQPQFSNIPWFINTMGFNKGLGVELMVNVIRMVGPSDIIQIQSSQKKQNFPELLEPVYVCDYQSTLIPISSASCSDLAYNIYELQSAAELLQSEHVSHWGMEAHKLRDLVILSYLGQILMPSQHSLTEVVPVRYCTWH
ncbi:polynucleotide 5'-hydroxyl-kinase NOL9 isoform X2 [Anabrus simplex]|uniref:polynucleotide 5'-hydroxyl-kinase NOL9 isoform X2 n=1 Tax=Anabrus simplex TaxID=316456 RepID=UPI0035A31489